MYIMGMSFFGKIFGLKPTAASKQDKVEKHLEVGRSAEPRVYSGKRLSMFEKLTYNFKSLFERTFSLNLGIQARNISGLRALTAAKVDPIAVFVDLSAAVRDMPGIVTELTLDQKDEFEEQVNELSNQQLMRLRDNLNVLRDKAFYGSLKGLRDDKRKDIEVRRLCQFNLDLLDAVERVVSDRLEVEEEDIRTLTIPTSEPGESLLEDEETVVIDYDMKLMNALKKEALNQKGLNSAHQQQEAAIRLLAPANLIDTLKQSNEPGDIFKALSMEVIKLSEGLASEGDQFIGALNLELNQFKDLAKDNNLKNKLTILIQNGWPQALNQLIANETGKIAQEEKKGNAADYTLKRLLENNKLMFDAIKRQFGDLAFINVKSLEPQAIAPLTEQLTVALDEVLTPVYSKSSGEPGIFKDIAETLNNFSENEKRMIEITAFGQKFQVGDQFDKDAHRWHFECKEDKKGKAVSLQFLTSDKTKGYEQLLQFFGYDDAKEKSNPGNKENQTAIQRFMDFTFFATQRCEEPILTQLQQKEKYFGPIVYETSNGKKDQLTINTHTKNESTESGKRIFGKTAEGTFYVIMEGKQAINRLSTAEQGDIPSNPLTTTFEYSVKFDYKEAAEQKVSEFLTNVEDQNYLKFTA